MLPDDERLAPLWERAGQLGLPVLVHVADPVAFFEPVDRHNERLEELL
ncbi:amidohydrolase, partial [Streptomyces sp. NP160]